MFLFTFYFSMLSAGILFYLLFIFVFLLSYVVFPSIVTCKNVIIKAFFFLI